MYREPPFSGSSLIEHLSINIAERQTQQTISSELPFSPFFTRICWGMLSSSLATWEIIPTRRFPSVSRFSTAIALSSTSLSSEPNPSSINRVSSCHPPARFCTTSDNPSASASETKNDSPPERDWAGLHLPVVMSNTDTSSPATALSLPACVSCRSS